MLDREEVKEIKTAYIYGRIQMLFNDASTMTNTEGANTRRSLD